MELVVELCDVLESYAREFSSAFVRAEQPGGFSRDAAVAKVVCSSSAFNRQDQPLADEGTNKPYGEESIAP